MNDLHIHASTLIDVLTIRKEPGNAGITFIKGSKSDEFLSYRQLYDNALKVLSFLQAKGLQPKDELVFQIEDAATFLTVFWACILGGMIPVPLSIGVKDEHKRKLLNIWPVLNNPFLIGDHSIIEKLKTFSADHQLSDLFSKTGSKIIDVADINNNRGYGTIHNAQENDIAFVQFSSGSTGQPKGVTLTHKNLLTNVRAISRAAAYAATDSLLSWMPLTHDMGLIGFHLNPLYCGLNHYLIPPDLFIRRPAIWLEKASAYKATILCSPNFGYSYFMRHCTDAAKYNWDLSGVRIIYNGAEPVAETLCRSFTHFLSPYGLKIQSLCPVYGLAEATLAVSISGLEDDVLALNLNRNKMKVGDTVIQETAGEGTVSVVNVGKAIDNCSIRITDRNNLPLNEGVIGLVQIKGDNVTSGYYNNEPASRQVISQDGWLNTGDLGFIVNNALFITGRDKDIIFINGQNFYPHDIENLAETVEGVELNKIAVVGHFNAETGKEEVIAFILHRGNLEKFMPVYYSVKETINVKTGITLDKIIPVLDIPRTTSGKLQRFRLIEQYTKGEFNSAEAILNEMFASAGLINENDTEGPLTEVERKVLAIWKKVLNNPSLHTSLSFFAAGGNSLKLAEVAMLLSKEFNVQLPFDTLYEKQTIKEVAAEIERNGNNYASIPKTTGNGSHKVSTAQRRLYYAWELDRLSTAYNVPAALSIKGHIEPKRLEVAINALVARHDPLRMSFSITAEPLFQVHDHIDHTLDCITCTNVELDVTLKQLVKPFDLTCAPLFRSTLIKIGGEEWVLFMDFHHIIADGLSVYKFIDELILLYEGEELLPLPVSYTDYADHEKEWLRSDKRSQQETYWLTNLGQNIPLLEMPYDFQRPAVKDTIGGKLPFMLSANEAKQLRKLAVAMDCTLHVLMLAAYKVLLYQYTGQEELIVGIPVSGRDHPEIQNVLGMFVNNLPVKSTMNGSLTFAAFVQKVKETLRSAFKHQEYPFDHLAGKISGKRDAGRHPVFDTMFVFQHMQFQKTRSSGFTIEKHFFDPGCSKYDISLEIFDEEKETIEYYFEYNSGLFRKETIKNIAGHYKNILQAIVEDRQVILSEISTLDKQELHEYVYKYNATESSYPADKTIYQLFEEQVNKFPERIAIEYEEAQLTYKELNDKAGRVAGGLLQKELQKGEVVCILLPRSPELIIGILGVLQAGGAFLLIDPQLPEERIRYMVVNSGGRIMISINDRYAALNTILSGNACEFVDIHKLQNSEAPAAGHNVSIAATGLAYLIYTSGTSGNPKAVMIAQRSLVNYISWAAKQYVRNDAITFPLYTSVLFDLTITSIFTPLITGNKMVIYGDADRELVIEKIMTEQKVDIIKLTPSHLRVFRQLPMPVNGENRIKRFIIGGEALETELARAIYDKLNGEAELYNEYGPTEATVGCMIHKFDNKETFTQVPIGIPADNVQIYLLNKYLHPVPAGVTGELYISGHGVALGYLNNEKLTAARFLDDPFVPGQKMYKTGDMARRLHNGLIEYTGRIDLQVKINGYRIELSEIEAHLTSHPHIREAVVTAKDNDHGRKLLYAYYTSDSNNSELEESAGLKTYLAGRLPYYMVPSQYVRVNMIPLTHNGKVDHAALTALVTNRAAVTTVAPANKLEEVALKIWKEVLTVSELGLEDNFFESGGDSIKAVQIASRLFENNILVQVKDILTYQTIRQICRYAKMENDNRVYEQGIVEGEKELSPVEHWFFKQHFKDPNIYNQTILLRFNRPVNKDLLEVAFDKLKLYHDGLRFNYDAVRQKLFYNNKHLDINFHIEEWDQHNIDGDIKDRLFASVYKSTDVTGSLLLKAYLLNDGFNGTLAVTAHHLIIDGISWRILLEDLYSIYTSLELGKPVQLPLKTASLIDWQKSLTSLEASGIPEHEKQYWKAVEDIRFSIPQDFHTTDYTAANMAKAAGKLNQEQTAQLLKAAYRVYKADAQVILCTALVLALRKWTQVEDYLVELESHGRHLTTMNTSRTVGWFTAMYPVHFTWNNNGIGSLIKATKEKLKSIPNNGIGYGMLKNRIHPLNVEDPVKTVPVRLNYLGRFDSEFDNDLFSYVPGSAEILTAPDNNMTAIIECNVLITGNELNLYVYYNQKVHKQSTIVEFTNSFIAGLQAILTHIENEQEIQFTPSDFDGVKIGQEELDSLFE